MCLASLLEGAMCFDIESEKSVKQVFAVSPSVISGGVTSVSSISPPQGCRRVDPKAGSDGDGVVWDLRARPGCHGGHQKTLHAPSSSGGEAEAAAADSGGGGTGGGRAGSCKGSSSSSGSSRLWCLLHSCWDQGGGRRARQGAETGPSGCIRCVVEGVLLFIRHRDRIIDVAGCGLHSFSTE